MTTTPPLETEAQALALPPVAAILKSGPSSYADGNRAMISSALESCGVTLGAYEARVLLSWLPGFEPQAVAAVAEVIRRSHLAGQRCGFRRSLRDGGGDD